MQLSAEQIRFVRSKMWIDFLKERDAQYLKNISSLKQALEFQYRDGDFVHHVVTDMDFRFAESLMYDDYDWEL